MSHKKEAKNEKASLDDIQLDYISKVGHAPHSVSQLVNFCKYENHSWKYREIKKWWPTRPDPQSKPNEEPINLGEYQAKMLEEEEYFVDGCYLIKTCPSLKRLCLALNFFKNNDNDDILMTYFTKYKHILNDYGHIIYHHLNGNEAKSNESFKIIFDEISKEIQCDINTCYQYVNYHKNREKETKNNKDKVNSHLLFYINLMNKIHCHFLHSYDTGFKIAKLSMQTESTQSINETSMYIDHEMQYIHRLINDKSQLLQHIERKSRYTTNIQSFNRENEIKSECDNHQFGDIYTFYYEDKQDDEWYIKPHFSHFKAEIIDKLPIFDYQCSVKKVEKLLDTEHMKNIENKIESNHITLTEEHLLSIILFTDYNRLSQTLRATFTKISDNESNGSLKERHSFYVHWSLLLRESIDIFGENTQSTLLTSFYHSTDSLPFVNKFLIRLNAPISTTSQLTVAVIFDGMQKGIILDMRQNYSALKFFNCAFVSYYGMEEEKLFFCAQLLKMHSLKVFSNKLNQWENYQHCMKALECYENIIIANAPLSETDKNDIVIQDYFNIISDLALYELGTGMKCENEYPDYIYKLFNMYCKRKKTVEIDLSHTNYLYNFLEHLSGSNYSDLLLPFHEIGTLYKNCESIIVKKDQVVIVFDNFFNYLLSILDNINATNLTNITILGVFVKCTKETFIAYAGSFLDKDWELMVTQHPTSFNDLLISKA